MRALLLAAAALWGCASVPPTRGRDLPVGLAPLAELLQGCSSEPDAASEVKRVRCSGEVALATRPHADGDTPLYRAEAASTAEALGAQVAWDQSVVPTEAESGLVERGRALLPRDDASVATVLGVVRARGDGGLEEIWCTSRDETGDQRCQQLMGAALVRHGEALPAALVHATPPGTTLLGRALSLPTACVAQSTGADGGAAHCRGGTGLWWNAHDTMDDALLALHARLAGLGDEVDGAPFACSIVGEVGQCERREHSIGGVTYLDGRAVSVVCAGNGDLMKDGACRAALLPR